MDATVKATFLDLAVEAPLPYPLTYKTTEDLVRGDSVIVPLGRRKARAVILRAGENKPGIEIKSVIERDESRPRLPEAYIKWLEWIADYYVHPIGQVMELAFPPLSKKGARPTRKQQIVPTVKMDSAPSLMKSQLSAIEKIRIDGGFQGHLLHGVTGSGKTEVYLHLLEKVLALGKSGLVLVPEISLTPQLIDRFARRFGEAISVIHSQLTERERTNQWWSAFSGEKKILIGARSALFCPLPQLGLIVIDEEHEPSYKQDEKLKYNGRDAAVVLAKTLDIPIVMGSATPSLETWNNARTGRFQLHTMENRVADRAMPQIEVIDLREEKKLRSENSVQQLPFWMSQRLYQEISATLAKKEQVALFLNRRGVAPSVHCMDCGFVFQCANCAISLTLHGKNHLVCHYCDFTQKLSEVCPSCKTAEPTPAGLGTEQLESDIINLFPSARTSRADRDEISSREGMEDLISKMEKGEIDVLIGTQMIAKGLDFPNLNLVGLVLADLSFNIPDFRATERSYQLLTQMSGRSGRHSKDGGKVILQTLNPEHPSVTFGRTADYLGFSDEELRARKDLGYPPFGRLASLRIVSAELPTAQKVAEQVAGRCNELIRRSQGYDDIQVLGPAEAALFKLRGKYRFHVLLKCRRSNILSAFIRQMLGDNSWIPRATKVQVDIDPLNLM